MLHNTITTFTIVEYVEASSTLYPPKANINNTKIVKLTCTNSQKLFTNALIITNPSLSSSDNFII